MKSKFTQYLQQLGYSKTSIYALPNCIQSFLDYHHNTAIQAITQNHIKSFYSWLQTRPNQRAQGGLSEIYIYHHIYALKVFFNWLEQTNQITSNPISIMKFNKPNVTPRQPLSTQEITDLFACCTTKQETAILHLFYSCGLRRSEAVALNIRDIHFKNCILYVRNGKGAKRRAVPITAKVSQELENYYLQERIHIQNQHNIEAFILSAKKVRMTGDCYNKIFKKLISKAHLSNSQYSLHHLRHSIATHLLQNGLNIESVRDFLGHRHLESTQIYAKVSKSQTLNVQTQNIASH